MASVRQREAMAGSRLIRAVARVDLRVGDVERALGFYRDVVGLEVAEQGDSEAALRSPGSEVFLTLESHGVTAPSDPTATGLFHTAFRFPTRPDLGDALARLVAGGYQVGAGDHLVSEALYIDDPDGNGVELYWDRPVDDWPAPTRDSMVPMATLPVDLHDLLDAGNHRAAVGAPAPARTDIGHVHLQVSDIDATTRFYVDDLGLDLTGKLGRSAAFFSSFGYHHNIGSNTWRSQGGRSSSRDRAGLERIVFSVADDDELHRLSERVEGASSSGANGVVVQDPDGIELRFVSNKSST